MGLFDFGKKKNTPKVNEDINNPQEFYTLCLKVFHDALRDRGYATRGLIFIPELIPYGEKAVLSYLQDTYFQMELGNDAAQYYYVICSLSFMTGVVYAEKWHTNFSELQSGFAERIINEGAPDYAHPLLEKEVGVPLEKQAEQLFSTVYDEWLVMHEPYWKLEDPRKYTFNAMLASYQAGVSTILEKYGF